jgi:predicted AAA+ superfamily ATPase
LAKQICEQLGDGAVYLDLELPSDLAKLSDAEVYLNRHRGRLVILDEIHRVPELFVVMRALVDQERRPGRFLVLGSASPELLRQTSESLAGRITYFELSPFLINEVHESCQHPDMALEWLWIRGGYPDSFLAATEEASLRWRQAFVQTVVTRDLPGFGFRVSATRMRRFFEMLAHVHGQLWNASAFARSFDVSAPTARHHLDILTDTFLVRQLQPFHVNLKKRLVKSPKIYLRDTGLLHALLRIDDFEQLFGHPAIGASFEGFAIEQIIQAAPSSWDASFFRTHSGDEIDLVLSSGHRRIAIEIKHTASPRLRPGLRSALADINASRGYIVCMVRESFPLAENVEAVSLFEFVTELLPSL